VISTIAGTGTGAYSGDGGQATAATILLPHGIDVDAIGNIFFNDYNNRVRVITASTGIISTYVGTGSAGYSGDGGVASSAALDSPQGLCIDTSGNIYISDYLNNRLRKVMKSTSIISTIAGTGASSYNGDNGQAVAASVSPAGVAVDVSGNIYISDLKNHRIRKILASTNVIITVAGTGSTGYSGDGGQATAGVIQNPLGINLDSAGNIYFGDGAGYNVVRKVAVSTGIISTVAGTASTSGAYNGDNIQATSATLNGPYDVVLDSSGNLYICDRYNNRVRKVIVSTGLISTVLGTGSASSTGDGSIASSAAINSPTFSRFDSSGNYYVSECGGNRVRKVINLVEAPTSIPTSYPSLSPHSISVISTFAGTGSASYSGDNGQATSADINCPTGIAIDSSGNVYLNDFGNHRVRKVTVSTGIITTYAGTGTASFSGDGGVASSAALNYPNGLCIDSSGNNTQYFEEKSVLIFHHQPY
jgi:sugar lactone lactonase YvrE